MKSHIIIVTAAILGIGTIAGFASFNKPERVTNGGTTSVVTPVVAKADPDLIVSDVKLTRVSPNGNQVVLLNTEVNEDSVDAVINQLTENESRNEKIYLVISSPGGSVFAGNRLVSYLENTASDVHTVCSQVCASMAFHIFEAGKTRWMIGHSLLMGHPASGGARGTVPEMLSMLNAIKLMTDRMDAKIAARAKIAYKDFELEVLKNLWVETPDAIKMGLADGLIHLSYKNNDVSVFNTSEHLKELGIKTKQTKEIFPQLYEIQ